MNSSCNVSTFANRSISCTAVSGPASWYDDGYNVTMVVLYIVVICAAIIGNFLVCVAVYINPNLRHNVASYFIVSLAVSDFGTACFAMPFDAESFTTYRRWYHGEVLCIMWTTVYLLTVPSSIWNLFIMSIDRYKTLKNPWNRFKESHSMTARRAVFTIMILWVYCVAIALLPPVAGSVFKVYPHSVINNYCYFNISQYFSLIGSFVNFYLPMFAMCGIYYQVYKIARSHRKVPFESRFHKLSCTESNTACTVLAGESHVSTTSINLKQRNKQDIETLGLENISFRFEENRQISDEAVFDQHACMGTNSSDETCAFGDKNHKSVMSDYGHLQRSVNTQKTRICLEGYKSDKKHRLEGACTFKEGDADHFDLDDKDDQDIKLPGKAYSSRSSQAKQGLYLQNEASQTKCKHLSYREKYDSHGIEKDPTISLRGDTIPTLIRTKDSEKQTQKNSNSELFSSEKKVNRESPYPDDNGCRLKKFRQIADGDHSFSADSEISGSRINENLSNKKRLKNFAINTKAARTISVIVGAFLFCWIPFTTLSVTFNICGPPCWKIKGVTMCADVFLLLGYVNSALNPALFSYRNANFRKSFRKIGNFMLRFLRVH